MEKLADIILPIPLNALTYRVPPLYQNRISVGSGVLVPLGTGKLVFGIVARLHSESHAYPVKNILGVVYQEPLCTSQQLDFLKWIAGYYLSSLGEAMSAVLPKVLSEYKNILFQIFPTTTTTQIRADETEQLILHALRHQPLSYKDIIKLTDQKKSGKALILLLSNQVIEAVAVAKNDQLYGEEICIALSSTVDADLLVKQLDTLYKRSPKQQSLLSYFLSIQSKDLVKTCASKTELLDFGYSKSALNLLLKNSILTQFYNTNRETAAFSRSVQPLPLLTEPQKDAFAEIQKQFFKKAAVLLHGAIGSGKTVLYMHLIHAALCEQKQVLLLLPEISLVTHILARIKPFFGDWLVVYHSKQSNKERFKAWSQVVRQQPLVVIGARSALFLPFSNLKLIIVDEEHDSAYKHTDHTPTYHARDCSILLAKQHQAKVLLGSGTPSIESYYNAQSGKYGLVALPHRFGKAASPNLFFIDLNIEKKRKAMRENFSFTLLSNMKKNMQEGGQAMIFQNRRGYARYCLCESCGWIPRCLNCAVSLTYHQEGNRLLCHYCDYAITPFLSCSSCGSQRLHNVGFGTEKLEETLQLIFPEQQIGRMDLDTTKGKNSYASILDQVTTGSIHILVGTQMIAKGLDFANIRLIGILDIDALLFFPDFRSNEKCFQLITQLAGRAGRRNHQGTVWIQTRQPNHVLFRYLANNDYQAMYHSELAERKSFLYPPYVKLIKLTLSCIEEAILKLGAIALKQALEKKLGRTVLGPQQPLIGKVRNLFLLDLLIKVPSKNTTRLKEEKEILRETCKRLLGKGVFKKVKVLFDVDPV
ncbi:replication restart helicase PriA [Cardinium endosymbiont of Tipula unca]|uniref:replication restart helicase PriA n=1 Tax=Cardinium endosymbiont of Tipula unca TaxID=3066216 RepID=UPI0030CA8778